MLECWEITYTETETRAGSRDDQKWVETQLITIKGNKTQQEKLSKVQMRRQLTT